MLTQKRIPFDSVDIKYTHKLTTHPDYFHQFAKVYRAALSHSDIPIYRDFLNLNKMQPFLSTISVLDLREFDRAQYRFCGAILTAHTGADLTGQNLFELIPKKDKDDVHYDLKSMMNHPCGNFSRHMDLYAGGKRLAAESLSLPLKSSIDSPTDYLVTLHASEWVFTPDANVTVLHKNTGMQIGVEWLQSIFVDIGYGIPGPTGNQRY